MGVAFVVNTYQRLIHSLQNTLKARKLGCITISLAPSHIKKEGSGYDLAIALGVLAASNQCNSESLKQYCFLGELSLDGSLRPCRGALPISMALAQCECPQIVLPIQNAKEAALVSKVTVWPMRTLCQAVDPRDRVIVSCFAFRGQSKEFRKISERDSLDIHVGT